MTADALIEAVAQGIYEFDHAGGETAINVAQWKALRNIGNGYQRDEYLKTARAALAAIEAQGFRVVPVGPSPEMIRYGQHLSTVARYFSPPELIELYAAMLSAAPKLTERGE